MKKMLLWFLAGILFGTFVQLLIDPELNKARIEAWHRNYQTGETIPWYLK
jgi:hypothetical protein